MTRKEIKEPLACDVELVCKATGELKVQVAKELDQEDKALAELFNEAEDDQDTDAEQK